MPTDRKVYTVTQLNELIKLRIEANPEFNHCFISGEISNFKHHSSGHMYFTLKDDKSRIRTIMFASRNKNLPFHPEDGMRVICEGNIGVFERDGQYQLYVDGMQPDGIGALYIAYEQLRNQLAAEGLFNEDQKKALPQYPKRIGVVTSPTGAVIQDICSTLERRYPLAQVILSPALVQGPGASQTIVAALRKLIQLDHAVDVIIIGRGGGSLEELWPFNEEIVARAIFACPIPIVSAVGHETDVTICDFVADVRAATPTAAAELVAPHISDLQYHLQQSLQRAEKSVRWRLQEAKQRLHVEEKSNVLVRPLQVVDMRRQTLDYIEGQLRQSMTKPIQNGQKRFHRILESLHQQDPRSQITKVRQQLNRYETISSRQIQMKKHDAERTFERTIASLEALNPLRVLQRGYSIVYGENKQTVIQSIHQVQEGAVLHIQVMDGQIQTVVQQGGGTRNGGKQARLDI